MLRFNQSNHEGNPRPGRRKPLRRLSMPLTCPWWDLSDIKPGLERKQFVAEMAGMQERLCGLVPYLDNLEDRSVLVEAWHVLEGLGLARQKRRRTGQAAPQLRNRPRS
jgi:hypothetical protein